MGAGAGSAPYFVGGHAYLAGPYKSAPLSLLIVAPAVAGPFDLGNVVTRVALNVDPFTAQIDAVSDPLPTILDGIPLDLRQISLNMNRPNFILNPTSCREKRITGSAISQAGAAAPLLNRFQVGGCGKLAFKPKLKLSLSGSDHALGPPGPEGRAHLSEERRIRQHRPSPGQPAPLGVPRPREPRQGLHSRRSSSLARARSARSTVTPRLGAHCFEKPLEGPVYLGVGFGDKLPDLVAELNGQIRVLLKGKVDSDSDEGIRNTFEAVPDAPVSRFQINLKGGKKYGLLQNSENICLKAQRALTRFTSQSGIIKVGKLPIGNSCGSPTAEK